MKAPPPPPKEAEVASSPVKPQMLPVAVVAACVQAAAEELCSAEAAGAAYDPAEAWASRPREGAGAAGGLSAAEDGDAPTGEGAAGPWPRQKTWAPFAAKS